MIKVGQPVILNDRQGHSRTSKIAAVGRKYFYLHEPGRLGQYRFRIATLTNWHLCEEGNYRVHDNPTLLDANQDRFTLEETVRKYLRDVTRYDGLKEFTEAQLCTLLEALRRTP